MNIPPAMSPDASTVTIYADGACSGNPGPGGYGVILIRDGQRQELAGGFRRTTNNRMELMGAIVGLRALSGGKFKVTIYSDSTYVTTGFNDGSAAEWRRHAWTLTSCNKLAANPDLWSELLDLAAQHEVKFVWVKGHASNRENARCDELAVAARQSKDLLPDEAYEDPRIITAVYTKTATDLLHDFFG